MTHSVPVQARSERTTLCRWLVLSPAARVRYNSQMRFTLDGEHFELTPDNVRVRLRGHVPEDVREYWVEIEGDRWPVKQVISIATGARRTRFQSQDSRRWLEKLGFQIGQGGSDNVAASATRSAAVPRGAFDGSKLQPLETIEVTSKFTWLGAGALTLDGEGLPSFPPLPPAPGLYRFDFGTDDEGVRTLYIGESVSIRRRASNYRNAKTDRSRQRTSRRIHKEVVEHLNAGGTIGFAVATAVVLADGKVADLRLKSARRLAENAAVLMAQLERGVAVLNIDADLTEPSDSVDGDDV